MDNAAVSLRESDANLRIQEKLDKKARQKRIIANFIPYIGLVFIFLFFVLVTGGKFISAGNIDNLINQGFTLALVAVGASFVYAHGGSDFSIGATSGCAQLVCGALLLAGMPVPVAIMGCILVAVVGASMVAGISLGLGVPVFIGSMCVRTAFMGVLQWITETGEIVVDFNKYNYINNTALKGIIMLVFVVVGYYLFNYTTFGKYNKAIGGNSITATQAGVKRKNLVFAAYLALGLCVGIAATFSFFRAGRVTAQTGSGTEFNMMMAIILGGFPMSGGDRAKLSSAIVGALTVTFLSNGLLLWGLDTTMVNGVKGLLFVAIIALSYDRSAGKLVS